MKFFWLLATPLCLAPSSVSAQTKTELPLRQVTLFSSGVGYFARAGQIDGDAAVDLTVRAPQISDLLKSLVLFDEKGNIAPVSYSIADSVGTRTVGTDLNLPDNATPGTILRAFRGATVQLDVANRGSVVGRIASVSTRQLPTEKGVIIAEVVNLLSENGLQSVDINDVQSFRFPDAALQTKFVGALEKSAGLLTTQLDNGARSVTLRFNGKGKREARAGYLLEMPTWKTSYRLVLDEKKKPYLQGWAIVENPTDADWKDVQLSLVAGRPISFVQNLAIPIYVTRPIVQSEIPNASFTPQTFGDSLGSKDIQLNGIAGITSSIGRQRAAVAQGLIYDNELSPSDQRNGPRGPAGTGGGRGGGFAGAGGFAGGNGSNTPVTAPPLMREVDISAIAAQASAADAGELFVYAIDQPLSLPRGEAAMVPIVSRDVAGEALTIINAVGRRSAPIAQNGFRLKNDSDLRLSAGPITVYQGGIYGGDARLDGLSPRDSKLIAFGIDLDLVVQEQDVENRDQLLQISVEKGVLQSRLRSFLTQNYTLKNKAAKAKTVLIQQPTPNGYELIDAAQRDEKSTEGDRFKIELKAGESREYAIAWQRTYSRIIAIGDFDFSNLDVLVRDKQIAPELKIKLEAVAAARVRVNNLEAQIAAQQSALEAIDKDQARLRENMKVLDRDSALYQTYAQKLGAQEERIVKIDAEIERLQAALKAAQAALAATIERL